MADSEYTGLTKSDVESSGAGKRRYNSEGNIFDPP